MPRVAVRFQLKTVSEMNVRGHWSVRAKRARIQRDSAWAQLKHACPDPPALPVVVTLMRLGPRLLDGHDNLTTALKHVVDGVAFYLGVDDADPRIEWRYEQGTTGSNALYYVAITVDTAATETT